MSRSEDRAARLLLSLIRLLTDLRPLTWQEKKAAGIKYNRSAGYGCRWFRGRRVEDEEERAVMGRIITLREDGHSWEEIAILFLRERVRTRDGREWSVCRIRRCHAAELRLRAAEQPPFSKT